MSNNRAYPFFSIVMPTYNRANLIIDSINTAIAQQYPHFEIIVVDDGSTDNTEEVITALNHPKIRYHKKVNEERAAARNTGTQLAVGDYVTFFDSDDYLYPHHLTEAVKLIEDKQRPEMIYLAYNVKDIHQKVIKEQKISKGTNFNKILINGNYLSCNGVFLRHDVALQHPFNTNRTLSASEDYDLWLRLAARYTIHYSNVITSTILNHDERSVLMIKKEPLINRINILIQTCINDTLIKKMYHGQLDKFISKCYLYISLHLAMSKQKRVALAYFFKGIKKYPLSIFDVRVYGIIKCLLIY